MGTTTLLAPLTPYQVKVLTQTSCATGSSILKAILFMERVLFVWDSGSPCFYTAPGKEPRTLHPWKARSKTCRILVYVKVTVDLADLRRWHGLYSQLGVTNFQDFAFSAVCMQIDVLRMFQKGYTFVAPSPPSLPSPGR